MYLATQSIFDQLICVLNAMDERAYVKKSEVLSGSTIGQHVRHVIEFYQCLLVSAETGTVNYDARKRNVLIEENCTTAMEVIQLICNQLASVPMKLPLSLLVDYSIDEAAEIQTVSTTFERELVYNMEHAMHHMAIIKIGLREVAKHIVLPQHFGIALSTQKHLLTCAQ